MTDGCGGLEEVDGNRLCSICSKPYGEHARHHLNVRLVILCTQDNGNPRLAELRDGYTGPSGLPDLNVLIAHWQSRLRLMDWRIEAKYLDQIDEGRTNGNVETHCGKMSALIRISRNAPDVEVTFIHEMLHIVMSPLTENNKPGTVEGDAEETIIDRLTRALCGRSNPAKWGKD